MTMQKSAATILLTDAGHHLEGLLELMARHDVVVAQQSDGHLARFPSGRAWLTASIDQIRMEIEALDLAALNSIKLELRGSLSYVCGRDLDLMWTGNLEALTRPTKLCVLTVTGIEQLTPHMRRITFTGDNLVRFAENTNLHMRLAIPNGAVAPPLPMVNGQGRIVWPEGVELPTLRKYTVRKADLARRTVAVDFVIHDDAGPGSRFAANAKPGDVIAMIGPGGLTAAPSDWYLLAGDETALPAIGRILENLPAKARGVALIEVAGPEEELILPTASQIEVRWLHRNGAAAGTTTLLIDAIRKIVFPADGSPVFAWAAGEFDAFKAIRAHLRKERGLPADRQLVVSYWRRGHTEDEMERAK